MPAVNRPAPRAALAGASFWRADAGSFTGRQRGADVQRVARRGDPAGDREQQAQRYEADPDNDQVAAADAPRSRPECRCAGAARRAECVCGITPRWSQRLAHVY